MFSLKLYNFKIMNSEFKKYIYFIREYKLIVININ